MAADLHSIVGRVLDVPPEEVRDDMSPKTVGTWTSLRHVQLVAAVEDEYGIRLTPREIRSVRTVSDLRSLVLAKSA